VSGYPVLLPVLLLWSAVFFYLYTRQVKVAGRQETGRFFRRVLAGRGLCHWEEKESHNELLFCLAVKMGELFLAGFVLRFFLAPDPLTGLLLTAVITGGIIAGRRGFFSPPVRTEWEKIYPLPEGYGIFTVNLSRPGKVEKWIGATLSELDLRKKNLLVLAILRAGQFVVFPKGPEVLATGDRLVIFGKKVTPFSEET